MPYIAFSIDKTECFKVKRGLNQQKLTINFEEDVQRVKFDKDSQSFLIFFEKQLLVLSKDAKFLKRILIKDLLSNVEG